MRGTKISRQPRRSSVWRRKEPRKPAPPVTQIFFPSNGEGLVIGISEGKPGCWRVPMKHLDRVERILMEILADESQLLQNIVSQGDDVAADCVGLKHVQEFAGARPDEFLVGVRPHDFECSLHQRQRVDACIGNPARKDGDAGGRSIRQRGTAVGTVASFETVQDKSFPDSVDDDFSINLMLYPFSVDAFIGKPSYVPIKSAVWAGSASSHRSEE